MKYYSLLLLICLGFTAFAQKPTAAEIKKLKIKSITRQDQANKQEDGKTVWYYNANGDDTATYYFGKRSNYKTNEYDSKFRIIKTIEYTDAGIERETTVYTYQPDGSFTSVNKDKQYGMTITDVYNTKGLKIKSTIPDGTIHHYEYNAKSQLIKYYTEPKNGGLEFTSTYIYNAKGRMIRQLTSGEYPADNSYEYDANGLLTKATITDGGDSKEVTVYLYTYGY